MLKTLTLQFGPDGSATKLSLSPERMTVFVGPNNSGKSLVLREIQQYAENGKTSGRRILEHLLPEYQSPEVVEALLQARQIAPLTGQLLPADTIRLSRTIPSSGSASQLDVNVPQLASQLTRLFEAQRDGTLPPLDDVWNGVFQQFMTFFTIALDGRTRFMLTEPRPMGDLLHAPPNHLAALFTDENARRRVRQITAEALGQHLVIDPTNGGTLRMRMSARAPADNTEEQALDERARSFHRAAIDIAEASDGVKAFVGLVSALNSSDFRVILVDEPEAFLHPPLARKLGKSMAELAAHRKANVFAATHSAHYLMGCIDAGTPTNIVRLTHSNGKATARHLPHGRLESLMRDPLLRSTGVLNALFYSCAVVCEADRDRAFYDEINTRLSASGATSVQDGLFLNAQNKQTIRRIVEPLREMGIPAAAIVDIDILKGTDLRDLLNACSVPEALVQSITTLRGKIEAEFKLADLDMKQGGVALLDPANSEALKSLLQQLADYGIFVVPIGEVESWLKPLGVTVSKDAWLSAIFERMRADPKDADYVLPGTDDVWGFLGSIGRWTSDPNRKGIPAGPPAANRSFSADTPRLVGENPS